MLANKRLLPNISVLKGTLTIYVGEAEKCTFVLDSAENKVCCQTASKYSD